MKTPKLILVIIISLGLTACGNVKSVPGSSGGNTDTMTTEQDPDIPKPLPRDSADVGVNEKFEIPEPKGAVTWMMIDPLQCQTNPWEQDWIKSNPHAAYPTGDPLYVEDEEKWIIMKYYGRLNINIYDVFADPFPAGTVVCDACNCPVGYTMIVKVDKDNEAKLISLGFRSSGKYE